MKRLLSMMVVGSVLVLAVSALAAGQKTGDMGKMNMKPAAAKTATLKGEIVDMGCYVAKDMHGAGHESCATKCISGGTPMGLLTANGKIYLLTLDHDNADPYNQCKGLASKTVAVTGEIMQRNGVMAIDVTGVKAI